MQAYKLKDDLYQLKAGRIFYELGTETLLVATPTISQSFFSTWSFNQMKHKNLVEEIDLLNEVKIHPHLYKPVKDLLNKQLGK